MTLSRKKLLDYLTAPPTDKPGDNNYSYNNYSYMYLLGKHAMAEELIAKIAEGRFD